MTLEFITGLASDDHRQTILKTIDDLSTKHPDDRFFYLVPNHIKFDAEVNVLTRYGAIKATEHTTKMATNFDLVAETQLQVFSIKRLVWFFMNHDPLYQQDRISKSGLFMLVQRAFQEAQGLQIFQRMSQKSGFIEQLAAQISEFRLSNITSQALQALSIDATGELKKKLSDLSVILAYVEDAVGTKLLTDNDMLNAFAAWLTTADLSGMHFYFEGFSQFTIAERRVLEVLLTKADVTLALVTNAKAKTDGRFGTLNPTGFFGRTNKLINELTSFAKQQKIEVKVYTDVLVKRPMSEGMQTFETTWLQAHGINKADQVDDIKRARAKQNIKIYEAESLQTEVEQYARFIRQQVSVPNSDYRYQDFLIVARDLTQYQTMLVPIFTRYQIPIFTDLDFAMTNHPLVEFLRALLEIIEPQNKNYYQYYTLMRLLKTQLLRPQVMSAADFRSTLDNLENYLLAFNPRKSDWESDEDWKYTRSSGNDEDWQLISVDPEVNVKINQIRRAVVTAITQLRNKLQNTQTMKSAISDLYQWLLDFGILDVLKEWRQNASDNGDIEASKQPEEVWKMFVDTIDEMVKLVGNETFNSQVFNDTILAGFNGAKFSGIPAMIDKVQISEMGIVQNDSYRVVMMLGGTKLNLPAHIKNHSLLNDRNRDEVKVLSDDIYLRDTSREQMAEEPLLAYLSWSRAKEMLILSYPARSSEGNSQQMSPYFQIICHQLGLKATDITKWTSQPDLLDTLDDTHRFIGTKRSTINHLAKIKRQNVDKELPAIWRLLENYLKTEESLTEKVLASLHYKNTVEPLAPDLVAALFKNKVQVSISKLQTYNQNPYEYFLKHGLRLQERPVFELTPADSGQLFHEVLEKTINEIVNQKLKLGELSFAQAQEMIAKEAHNIFNESAFKILKSSSRMEFMQQQLFKVVSHTFDNIRRASINNASQIVSTEIPFGNSYDGKTAWKALTYDLGDDKSMQINGKIDRLDIDSIGNNLYLNVIDYKSGAKKFDFKMTYNGLALQLLTYLLAVRENTDQLVNHKVATSQEVKLGGAMFAHINNPKLNLKDIDQFAANVLSPEGLNIIDTDLAQQFTYEGLLLRDQSFLQSLQTDLSVPGKPNFYDFKFIGKEEKPNIGATKTVLSESDLLSLLAFNEHLLKDTGANILAGKFPIEPVRYNNQSSALQYSPFVPIMNFDVMIDNQYREIENIQPEEVLEISHLTQFIDAINRLDKSDINKLITELETEMHIVSGGVLTDIKAFENDTVAEALASLQTLDDRLNIRQKNTALKLNQMQKAEMIKQLKAEKDAEIKRIKEQDKSLSAVAKAVKKLKKLSPTEALADINQQGEINLDALISEIDVLKGLKPIDVVTGFQAVKATKLAEMVSELKLTLGEHNNG